MITDPWQHMLLAIEPEYIMYKIAMEMGPTYVPVSTYIDTIPAWELKIVEQWPDGIDFGTAESEIDMSVRCKWCALQLANWPEVSYQQAQKRWHFKNCQDIEKFITMYYLKWQ